MRPGNPLGNDGQRAIALALISEPVVANEHGMGVSAPLTHQDRAGLRHDSGIDRKSTPLPVSCEPSHTTAQRGAGATKRALLQIIGKGSDQQIAAEA